MERPQIFQYSHYREYLRDMYHYLKVTSGGRFSFRIFAKKARMGSPNYLKMVMDGQRELSMATIQKFGRALSMNKTEVHFLETLVFFCRSKTSEEKDYYFQKLKKYKRFKLDKNLEASQYSLFSHWYLPVIREMVLLKEFKEDPIWIAKKLDPPISISEAREALNVLKGLDLLKMNDLGNLVQNEITVATDTEENSPHVWNFHRKMVHLAYQALLKPAQERNIAGMTIAVSKEQYEEIKRMITSLFVQIQDTVNEHPNEGDVICQINFQQFKLTKEDTP